MRLLILIILFNMCSAALAQLPFSGTQGLGAYSLTQSDVFSSMANVAAMVNLDATAMAVTGNRPYNIEELAIY